MRKHVSLFLAMILALSLALTACGNGGASSAAGSTPAPAGAEASDADSGAAPAEGETKNIRMAFLFSTSVNDGGWITSHDLGRQACDELPGVETTYLDNIDESNGWKYINDFAEQGYDIVIPCSYGYMEDTMDVASKHPDTIFEHCSGYLTAENMGNYFGRDYEATFLTGMACGATSETDKVGYVVSYPTPQVLRNVNAFAAGVRVANPAAVVKVAWVLSWYDPTLEREAAEGLIAAGCDTMGCYMNSPTVLQTGEKSGALVACSQADMSSYAPEAHLMAQTWDWAVLYTEFAKQVQNGTWQPESIFWGIQEGLVGISAMNDKIPQETQDQITDYYDRMKVGDETAMPFYGEIKDQSGEVRIEAGRDATVEELMSMDYLIDNVEGEIPA